MICIIDILNTNYIHYHSLIMIVFVQQLINMIQYIMHEMYIIMHYHVMQRDIIGKKQNISLKRNDFYVKLKAVQKYVNHVLKIFMFIKIFTTIHMRIHTTEYINVMMHHIILLMIFFIIIAKQKIVYVIAPIKLVILKIGYKPSVRMAIYFQHGMIFEFRIIIDDYFVIELSRIYIMYLIVRTI